VEICQHCRGSGRDSVCGPCLFCEGFGMTDADEFKDLETEEDFEDLDDSQSDYD
jgi:hypothetical protein